ncbi:MAG TPA: M20/M25/M40 family metallo-hydrolase, partial [Kofleriaceae bacterium]|nr:M20/M25/M40 family metallo-hydrolase [Kofleriaceae bacterium]
MRHALALAVLLGASTASAQTIITIGSDAVPIAIANADHGVIVAPGADPGSTVLEVDDADLATISEQMHHVFHRCGGMIQHPSLEEALHPVQLRSTKVDYSLDHAAAVEAVLPRMQATAILQTIRELSAMPNRYYKSAAGAEASNWLAERWRSFATRPGVTVQLVDHGYPQKGVVLTIPGTTRADEVIVLGGHLDSIAMGGISSNAPGADDDASGIATLTEIARALLAADYRPERTIKIIAYEAEEVGLLGSQAIVRDFKRANTNVVGAL